MNNLILEIRCRILLNVRCNANTRTGPLSEADKFLRCLHVYDKDIHVTLLYIT